MSITAYKRARKRVREAKKKDLNWLAKWLEEDLNRALDIDEVAKEAEVENYLEQFIEKMEGKTFARNLERLGKGELEDAEVKKVTTSMLTHLYIEKDKSEVPETVVEHIERFVKEDAESQKEFLKGLISN